MILAFEFNYLSRNGVLENLLKEICLDFSISHAITRDALLVTLFVEDSEERLGCFADTLSQLLPLSLFFKSSSVYVAETMPQGLELNTNDSLPLSFTPKMLASIETPDDASYLLPFKEFKLGHDVLVLEKNGSSFVEAKDSHGLDILYSQMCEAIIQGHNITMTTRDGDYVFGKIENITSLQTMNDIDVLATDLSVVERMVVIKENEIKALASLERPSIRFKVNALFAAKNILPSQRVTLRLADELIVYHLCKRLFAQGIHFLFKAPQTLVSSEYQVTFKGALSAMEPLEVTVLDNGEMLITKGASYASLSLRQSLKKFEAPAFAAFASIMQEHELFKNSASCFYLSRKHDDKFLSYSQENGMLTLSSVVLPESFESLFDAIAQSSKSSARLVENYKEAFPEIYASANATVIPADMPKSIYSLWKMAAIVLGISNDFENAAECLIENAEDFGGQKGPRIDYYLQKEDALVSDFNYVKLIKSGMSFKLAGTDDPTLSFGYMQSLVFFLSDLSDYHKENLAMEKVALAGSLFKYRRLTEMVYKNLKPNHALCLNRELPIDEDA